MMRYRLRTLLIVLALGPPVLAGGWFGWRQFTAPPPQWRNVDGPGPDERDDWMVTGLPPATANAPTKDGASVAPLPPLGPSLPGVPFAAP